MSGLLIACRPSCTRASLLQLRENMAHAYVSHNRRRVRRSPAFETVLLDHLVRPQQQRRRDRQAEGFGRLEVDDKFKLRGLLDGEISGLGALEDLVHVGRRAPNQFRYARSIRHKPTALDVLLELVHRRQPVLRREHENLVDETLMDTVGCHEQRMWVPKTLAGDFRKFWPVPLMVAPRRV